MSLFDKKKAFQPLTAEEKKQAELRAEKAKKASAETKNKFAEIIADPRYKELMELLERQKDIAFLTFLKMDMNDPLRFSLQAELNVINSLMKSIEARAN